MLGCKDDASKPDKKFAKSEIGMNHLPMFASSIVRSLLADYTFEMYASLILQNSHLNV